MSRRCRGLAPCNLGLGLGWRPRKSCPSGSRCRWTHGSFPVRNLGGCDARTARAGQLLPQPQNPPDAPALTAIDDETDTPRRAAAAGMVFPQRKAVSVIKRQLLAGDDVPPRHDPDPPSSCLGAAVGRTRVIDQSSDVPPAPAIEIVALVQFEDINRTIAATPGPFGALRLPPPRFGLGDFLARVLNDSGPIGNIGLRVNPASVDGGVGRTNPRI